MRDQKTERHAANADAIGGTGGSLCLLKNIHAIPAVDRIRRMFAIGPGYDRGKRQYQDQSDN